MTPTRIPFNWEYYQKNRPRVETRDGKAVSKIHLIPMHNILICLIGEDLEWHDRDGRYLESEEAPLDLYMVVEPEGEPFKIKIKDGQIASITQGEHWFAARLPIEDGTYILRKI